MLITFQHFIIIIMLQMRFQLKVAYDSSVTRSIETPIRGHTPVRQTD